MNLYAYVGGDPVNFVDPTGLCNATDHNKAGGKNTCIKPEYDDLDNVGPEIVVTGSQRTCHACNSGPSLVDAFPGLLFGFGSPPSLGESYGTGTPEKVEPKEQPQQEDKSACLEAIGGGALDGIISPEALIGDALTATAFGAANASKVARAALPLGRALNIAKASGDGALVAVGIQGTAGGIWAYLSDPRCE